MDTKLIEALRELVELRKSAARGPWYVVGPPWGKGNWVSTNDDPHGGQAVCDCEPLSFDDEDEEAQIDTIGGNTNFIAAAGCLDYAALLSALSAPSPISEGAAEITRLQELAAGLSGTLDSANQTNQVLVKRLNLIQNAFRLYGRAINPDSMAFLLSEIKAILNPSPDTESAAAGSPSVLVAERGGQRMEFLIGDEIEIVPSVKRPKPYGLGSKGIVQVYRPGINEVVVKSNASNCLTSYDAANVLVIKQKGAARFHSEGADLISAERLRQLEKEGWNAAHDDEHAHGELERAAYAYLLAARSARLIGYSIDTSASSRWMDAANDQWPWEPIWFKPSGDYVRNLEKAGALIAAEIDRARRPAAPPTTVAGE